MEAAEDVVEKQGICNNSAAATTSAQQLFSDGGCQSRYSPGAVARFMPKLRALRQSGEYCDVKFRTPDGGTILAHRFVLADSYMGCGTLFARVCDASDASVGDEQGQLLNEAKWPPNCEVLVSDLSAQMLNLVVDLAYHVPLHEHVTTHNVVEVLEFADVVDISAVRNHCIKLLGENLEPGNCVGTYQLAVRKGYSPLNNEAFRFIVRNFQKVWTTSPQFQSLAFEELWTVLHDDELYVTSEVEGSFGAILKWIAGDAEARRGFLSRLLPLVRFLFGSNADMQKVEAEPLVRADKKALEVLNFIKQTLDNEALDNGDWGFWPYLVDRRWLQPRVPKDVIFMFGGWTRGASNSLFTYNCRSHRWVFHPNQHTPPRAYHGVTMLDGLIYFIGGFDGTRCHHSVFCLDVQEHKWIAKSNMHTARCYVSVALLRGHIYAMGGFDGEGRTSSCERYDAASNQWEFVAPMHDIRSDASAVSASGRIYIMGGFTGLDVLGTVEYYDPSTDAWTRVESMSTPRSGFKAVVNGGDVYVMGGFDGDHRLGTAERLDVRKGQWSQLPSMAFPRSNFMAALLEGSIYVAGGFDGTATVSLVERYDIETRQWQRDTDLRIPCSAAAAYVYHNVPNARRWI